MELWILGIVAAVSLVAVLVDRRRGSGTGRSVDFRMNSRAADQDKGDFHGPMSSGGGGVAALGARRGFWAHGR